MKPGRQVQVVARRNAHCPLRGGGGNGACPCGQTKRSRTQRPAAASLCRCGYAPGAVFVDPCSRIVAPGGKGTAARPWYIRRLKRFGEGCRGWERRIEIAPQPQIGKVEGARPDSATMDNARILRLLVDRLGRHAPRRGHLRERRSIALVRPNAPSLRSSGLDQDAGSRAHLSASDPTSPAAHRPWTAAPATHRGACCGCRIGDLIVRADEASII